MYKAGVQHMDFEAGGKDVARCIAAQRIVLQGKPQIGKTAAFLRLIVYLETILKVSRDIFFISTLFSLSLSLSFGRIVLEN
jgi:hypothetical protein